MEETKTRIKNYLNIINSDYKELSENHSDLLDFTIDEVIDRVELYLNRDDIPEKLERIISNIINTNLHKVQDSMNNDNDNSVVTSISDNGQSISFSNEVKKYFTTATDEDLFSGFSSLLSRYRRISVVYSKKDE